MSIIFNIVCQVCINFPQWYIIIYFFRYMHIYIDQWKYSHILPFSFLLLLCFTFHTKLLFSGLFCKWSVLSERFVNFIVLHYASSMLIMTSKSSIFFIYFTSHMILSSLRTLVPDMQDRYLKFVWLSYNKVVCIWIYVSSCDFNVFNKMSA